MRTKQLSLLPREQMNLNKFFGGHFLEGKRKSARPVSSKNWMHLCIKSSQARSSLSFVNNRNMLDPIFKKICTKWGIKILKYEWVWNHIHMIVMIPNRTIYKNWIKELTGSLVSALAKRVGKTLKGFFDHRPYTRVLEWGRDLKNAQEYLTLNQMELFGCRPFKEKKEKSKPKGQSAKRPPKQRKE